MDQLIGTVLHDRYYIQTLLGRQTGRRTFLAIDQHENRAVVIKLLLFNPDFTWDDLKLFEREAEVLKSLDHPALPQYLDYFEVKTEWGKGAALVQTYLEARSLQAWVQSGRTFSEEELRAIAMELLSILKYLHDRNPSVVHRDIKPSNILLGDRTAHSPGQLYLIDFGSVQTARHSGTLTIVGTYGYMPPEQFGGQTSPASDLYALGATLIYLATGRHPDQFPQRDMRICFEDQVSLSPPLCHWIKQLVDPRLEKRFATAAAALEQLQQPQPLIAKKSRRPDYSQVQINPMNDRTLEILLPSPHLHWRHPDSGILLLIYVIGIALAIPGIAVLGLTVLSLLMTKPTLLFMVLGAVGLWFIIAPLLPRRLIRYDRVCIDRETCNEIRYFVGQEITVGDLKRGQVIARQLHGLTPKEMDWLVREISAWTETPITIVRPPDLLPRRLRQWK